MTPELVGILSVGAVLFVGLGSLIVGIAAWQRADIRQVRAEVHQVRAELGAEIRQVHTHIDGLRTDVRDLDRRLARVEGVIEGMAYANGRDRGEGQAA